MQDLLRTKLFIPQVPSDTIPRSHLVEQLNTGLARKLILVTAPAGYGKTTLVTTWLHQLKDSQVIWISLDEGDNDVRRFFTYLVTAFCQLDESFEATQDAYLREPYGELNLTAIVTNLLNQVVAYERSVVLILDDYHEIEEPSIHEAISFWLDNQPPNLHLVMTSRSEPSLPLPRMRVRRELAEIDTEALRLSRTETTDFLNQHMRLNLSESDINHLDSVTEGWVASLQLAALSLQGEEDPAEFIQTFKGDNRYVVDYLVNEVLHKQPEYIRDFLLQTSILGRLNVQLCNAVTEQVGSQQILETLDQTRLFLIPLDDRRHWYRYHHLFAECLEVELQRTAPEKAPIYHERASHWFRDNGHLDEAIHHAFAAENNELAVNLIGDNMRMMLSRRGEPHRLQQWIQRLPDKEIHTSPQLLITKAWLKIALYLDHSTSVDELLDAASNLLYASNTSYAPSEIATMETEIALAHSVLEQYRGNLSQAIEYNMHALELVEATDSPILKIGARGGLTICHYQAGNIVQFLDLNRQQLETLRPDRPLHYAGYIILSYRIDALRLHGQLEEAMRLFQRFESTLPQQHNAGSATFVVSVAEVLRERNQLTQAVDMLIPTIESLKQYSSAAISVQAGAITLARIVQVQGKGQEALKLLKETQRDFGASNTYAPSARISATEAQLHLQQGNLVAAKSWVERSDLQADDTPTYLLEIDYLVLARVLIADGDARAAQTLLTKLEKGAIDGGREARIIEVYILQALAHQALDEPEIALETLGKATDLAYPEGFVRVFLDEGKTLVPLLKQIAKRGVAVPYIQQLLPLFEDKPQSESSTPIATTGLSITGQLTATQIPIHAPTNSVDLLLEPLTDRELDTLRYLTSDLTVPQIAEQMIVAPSTVRSYIKSVYGKLDVHSRMEAVNRARSLGLIA
ncbi:LuxR C-terminal-related transcriptional regulator [Chloroflexi bacterium TSY]|nr:LuxR C-terminal-related transcriptional regulator [Chloroflexi bacterium TSY]